MIFRIFVLFHVSLLANAFAGSYDIRHSVPETMSAAEPRTNTSATLTTSNGARPYVADLLMSYHRGALLPVSNWELPMFVIFWGEKWGDPTFVQDKRGGYLGFLNVIGRSDYFAAAREYFRLPQFHVRLKGVRTDRRPAPPDLAFEDGYAPIDEVCQVTRGNVTAGAIYYVLTDQPRQTGYCAYHEYARCSPTGPQFTVVYMPNTDYLDLDGRSHVDAGCATDEDRPLHSPGVSAGASILAHEFVETVTDPYLNGWRNDATEEEIMDACRLAYGSSSVRLPDGSKWRLQAIFSNRAYRQGEGYVNLFPGDPYEGQRGCVDGNRESYLPTPVLQPSELVNRHTVRLSWNNRGNQSYGFVVKVSSDGGLTYHILSVVPPNRYFHSTSSISGMTFEGAPGQEYLVEVKACVSITSPTSYDVEGCTDYSNVINVSFP